MRSERGIVFLISAVQFINVLEFVMVMPLGPDLAKALGIPNSNLGAIAASYTAAAAVAGLVASMFLDRFDRRSALGVAMVGLVTGTALGGLASGFRSLVLARLVAGVFGGPATSLAHSIVADVVPPERRGKAMGTVMSAFSLASVLGIPAGLKLAQWGTWRTPFLCVAGLGIVIVLASVFLLPRLRGHLDGRAQAKQTKFLRPYVDLLRRREVQLSYCMTGAAMTAGFLIIPNIPAYVQGNLEFPRSELGLLYLAGGLVVFLSTRALGSVVDRVGSFPVGSVGVLCWTVVLWLGYASNDPVAGRHWVPSGRWEVFALFIAFMLAMSARNVAYNTLTSKVPQATERARFLSLQSTVYHLGCAAGALGSSRLLTDLPGPSHALGGMTRVVAAASALAIALPFLFRIVEARVNLAGRPA